MALTRDFKDTVVARVPSDPAFARALLDVAVKLFLKGEPETAKMILRDPGLQSPPTGPTHWALAGPLILAITNPGGSGKAQHGAML